MISKCLKDKYPGNSIPGAGQCLGDGYYLTWKEGTLNTAGSGKNIAQLSPRKQIIFCQRTSTTSCHYQFGYKETPVSTIWQQKTIAWTDEMGLALLAWVSRTDSALFHCPLNNQNSGLLLKKLIVSVLRW